MKSIFTLLFACILMISCTKPADVNEGWEAFGAEIVAANYSSVDEVIDTFELDNEKEFKISGTLVAVCQSKGCWTTLQTEDNRTVRMTFANYAFFLPTDAAGKTIIAEGVGFRTETSVAELKHLAEDAKKSQEEIDAITEPKVEYVFEAKGVLLK
jgi:hypothetical protein